MVLRWLAVVVLALTIVVSGPVGPAQALVKPPVIDGERLLGGVVQTGKGVSKFGRIVPGPVGAILTVGSLAWWAYNEYDSKVHAPQPGGETSDWLGAAVAYPNSFNDGTIAASVMSVSGRTLTITFGCAGWGYHSGSGSSTIWKCGAASVGLGGNIALTTDQSPVKDVECRNTTTNVHTIRALTLSGIQTAAYAVAASPPSTTSPGNFPSTQCLTGEEIVGFRLSERSDSLGTQGASSVHRQTLPIGWGTLEGDTLPPGTLTFATAVIDVTCRNAATSAVQHIYVTSEWGSTETLDLPSCKQRLGSDWYGTGVKVIPMDPEIDDVPLDPEVWPDWDVPDFLPEEWTEEELTPTEEADPCHGTKRGCGLTINIDDEPVFPGSTTRTKIDTLITNDPDRVTCKWGAAEVEWKWCIPLLPTFEPGSGGATTTDPTKPETETGAPPTTGTGTQPVPTEQASCIKAAFSWNPIDWVYVPVKCVLTWAFVPTAWPAWGTIPSPLPVGWVPTFPAIAGGSCGPVMMPGGLNLGPLYPATASAQLFDSCDFAPVRAITYYGTLALVLVSLGWRAFNAATGALGMRVESGGDDV